jgi:tetratricopeptide (TPR) repeat protein
VREGDLVDDRFEIEATAGTGGMGTVYRARDRRLGVKVALKLLHGGPDHLETQRFAREAEVLASLTHAGIVRYVAHGTSPAGDYLATEWLDGEDLSDRLARRGLTVAESVTLARRVARALAGAHARGIIHRDIKPSNLFLPGGDIERVKVLDFGIARFTRATRAVTTTGTLIGTPGYMAPEQAQGARQIDARADVFSLGCVLFECLTGRSPFMGDHILAVLAKILIEDAPPVRTIRPDVPEALEAVVARMLVKEPEGRPADGGVVADELDALEAMPATGAAPPRDVRPTLTASEQRVMCILLAGRAAPVGPTLSPAQSSDVDEHIRHLVASYGGRADGLADGSLLVTLSGSGAAATDQAVRAARCGLALRPLLPELPMVLATGRGVLSARLPMGEVIDRAVRALSKAPVAGIRLDTLSAGLLDARFDVAGDDAGQYLRGERDSLDAARTVLGRPTTCVGRDRELDTLLALFRECCGEPVARAALVLAPAGVGKSRLGWEFVDRARRQSGALEVLTGRGDPIRAGSPFALIAQAVRRSANILEGEPLPERREKLTARVGRCLSGRPREAARVTEFLGELCSVPFPDDDSAGLRAARLDPMLMGDAMREAWTAWLAAECAVQPVLLVLEDLHWGDLPTVNFVDAALRNLPEAPLMVLALARPEVHDQFPGLWGDRALQELRLDKLSRKAAEKLVREVLGPSADPRKVAVVVDRADGNAFYLEELMRAVAEGKEDALPETVLGMVQARLDALGQKARRVLRGASIFGGTFWRSGIMALLGGEQRTTEAGDWLDYLVEREVVARRATSTLPGEAEYAFRHALVREAAYAMLTEDDRVLGHRLAGEWLERVGYTDAIALAEHFDRGQEPARAVAWYRRGAEAALEGNDLGPAVERAERGIARGAEGETRGALRLVQAEALIWRGDLEGSLRRGTEAAADLAAGSPAWFHAVEAITTASVFEGRFEAVQEWALEASRATPATPAGVTAQIVCLCRTVGALLVAGRYGVVDQLLPQIETLTGDIAGLQPHAAALVWDVRGKRAHHGGRAGDAVLAYVRSVEAAEAAGHPRHVCVHRANLGFALGEVGDWAAAERVLMLALAAAERMGLHFIAPWTKVILGNVLAHLGRVDEARAALGESLMAGVVLGSPRLAGMSRMYLAGIAWAAGDAASAEEEASGAAEALRAGPPLRPGALAGLARAQLALGKVDAALATAREARALYDGLGACDENESLIHLMLAEALLASGARAEAKAALDAAHARLKARAASIGDPEMRASFLSLPVNARTETLAREWAGGAPEAGLKGASA